MKVGRTGVFVLKSFSEARTVVHSRMLVKKNLQDSKILGCSQTYSMLKKTGPLRKDPILDSVKPISCKTSTRIFCVQPMPVVSSHHAKLASRVEVPNRPMSRTRWYVKVSLK